jgi:hypothetical protein
MRRGFSAIIWAMPSRTDDPPQTRPQITTLPDSVLAHSPAASPPLETADDELPTEESLRAFMSSVRRGGRWEPADEIHALAICGEVTLDFTRAELPPSGVVEIDALAIMGEVKIIVPDGAEIELDGTPILGSIEHQVRKKGMREGIREWVTGERDEDLPTPPPPAEPPYFRVGGLAIMGSIKVTNR